MKRPMRMNPDLVTIDGPAGSGKSTVSRAVAARLGYVYLDTGAMYRAVALKAVRTRVDLEDGPALGRLCRGMDLSLQAEGDGVTVWLDGEDVSAAIRTPDMDLHSSRVSAVPEVREAMTELQRRLGRNGRVVAEGRDMGTVVFPDARHKVFLTASLEVRAGRRYQERLERGEAVSLARVTEDLAQRDRQDASRALAPLRPAADAVTVDTTRMTLDEVITSILESIRAGR